MSDGFDIPAHLEKLLEVLRRDIAHLMSESLAGKLPKASAGDLIAYIKVLSDIGDRQAKDLKDMSDQALEALKS